MFLEENSVYLGNSEFFGNSELRKFRATTASGERQPPQPLPQANSLAAGFPVRLSGALEATTEAVRVTDEAQDSQLSELRALGILRPLLDASVFPRCKATNKSEAACKCSGCTDLFHVRCLHRTLDESRTQTKIELRQCVHSTLCQKCH